MAEIATIYCHHGTLRGACGWCRCEAERERLREALLSIRHRLTTDVKNDEWEEIDRLFADALDPLHGSSE